MLVRSRALLTCLVVCSMLLVAVSTTSANSLSVTSQSFRVVFSELNVVPSIGEAIRCNLTLEGIFHSAVFTKTAGQLVGQVTNAAVGICGNLGDATIRALTETLPWHLTYESFRGTLPAITQINVLLLGASFSWADWFTCLYRTSASDPQGVTFVRDLTYGQLTSGLLPGSIYPIDGSGWIACPIVELIGRGAMSTPRGAAIFSYLV